MGYRSDIYIKLESKHLFEFKKILEEVDLTDNFVITYDEDYIYALGESLKWYDSYEEVTAINNFIWSLGDTGGLIAIGEDDQTEYIGSPYEVDLSTEMIVHGFKFKEE